MTTAAVRLCVFAKLPAPGQAKTRLIPALGERGAAAVAEALLQQTLQLCEAVRASIEVELRLTPDPSDRRWQAVPGLETFTRLPQGDGDLGERMQRAAAGRAVIVIGSDCPSLRAEHQHWAAACIERGKAAMIPACDGGYVLLALPAPAADVFANIAWSTPAVAHQTRQKLHAAGLAWEERPPLADFDVIEDLPLQPAAFRRGCKVLQAYQALPHG